MTDWHGLLTDPSAAFVALLKLTGFLAAAWLAAYGVRRACCPRKSSFEKSAWV